MQATIYRGTHEVGGTMIELKSGSTRLLLDAGYPLFLNGEVIDDSLRKKSREELSKLGVIPKIKGLYRWEKPKFDGVLISHAHSDHYGLLNYIHPSIPIYLSETTDKLIEMSLPFHIDDYSERDRRIIRMGECFSIGAFAVSPFLMDHSAYRAAAFEIYAEGRTITYTGDFRGHGKHREYLKRFLHEAAKEPDLLLIEGTTLGRTGEAELQEDELTEEFKDVIRQSNGITLCQPTSQSIDRILSFYQAARACGKIFVIDIYTANLLYELRQLGDRSIPAPSLLRPDLRVFSPLLLTGQIEKLLGKKYSNRFKACEINGRTIGKMQKEIVMLVRPSMLTDLKGMKLSGGTLIYSMWQMYREKPNQVKMEKYLKEQGFADCYLHTSGHAFKEDIQKIIKGLSPKEIVPIHTFCPEAFYEFHPTVQVMQDGIPFVAPRFTRISG